MTQPNNIKQAVDFLINNKIIENICQSYVYEYLSSGGAAPGGVDPAVWADKLNTLLEAYKNDPDFAFLKETYTDEETGEEVTEYKRVDNTKEAYDNFVKNQFTLHTNTVASNTYKSIRKLFTTELGKSVLYTILQNANEVFRDPRLNPREDVANIEAANLGGAVDKPVLDWPTAGMTLNLQSEGIYLFFLFVYQTGWFTKDYTENLPVKLGATSLPDDRAELGDRFAGVLNPIYFPYMVPDGAPVYETKTVRNPGSVRDGIPPSTREVTKLTENTELVGIPAGGTFGPADVEISYMSNAGTIEVKTREELESEGYDFRGLTGGLYDERPGQPFAGNILFYNGGDEVRSARGPIFEAIYGWNEDVITSIATLYPSVTWSVFKSVLLDFVGEVDKNIKQAEGILGADEGDVRTPFTKKVVRTPKKEALKPVDHQCYLLENIRVLTEYKDSVIAGGVEKYENISTIYNSTQGKNSLPGNLISYINHADKTDEVNALLNLCPEVYALLTPHIKIYRVEYEGENKLIPTLQQEIPFPNFIDPSDIQAIMNNDYGRFPGAGIKSFSWNLDGVNPAEVDNNISARLDLHFQTIQDLFSLNQGLAAGQAKPGYLDLIIKSARQRSNKSGGGTVLNEQAAAAPISTECFEATMMEYDPRDFEIKACVGWSTPANFSNIINDLQSSRDKGPDYGINLEAAINETRVGLYLTLTTHELNFNENGSVDLSVNYQARLSGLARSPAANIFSGGTELSRQLKQINEKLKEKNKRISERTNAYDPENRTLALEDDAINDLRRDKEDLLEEKVKLTKQSKAIKYKRFLNKLYNDQKIYTYVVPASERILFKNMTPEERAKKAATRVASNEYQVGWEAQSDSGAAAAIYDSAAKQISEISKSEESDEVLSEEAKAKGAVSNFNLRTAASKTNTDLKIPFFYLGDLLDAVLEHIDIIVDKEGDRGSFQLILSQVELLDPLLAYQIESVKIQCPDNKDVEVLRQMSQIDPMRFRGLVGMKFTTNIASMPISLEVFQEWFINNIVKPQVDNYNVLRFIKTVCSSLIGKAFNASCFEDLNFNLRFDTSIFNFDKTFTGKVTTVEELASSKKSADKKDCIALPQNQSPTIPTFVLYSVDSRPMTGNYDDDLNTGIYHYYLGAACGIAKKISFNRTDIPYYREGRLQRKSALSALQLRELYNANIQMIGNNLHKNGQYIYVNPIAIGAGSMQQKGSLPNLARLLGIGGYYMVTKVSHDISSAGFNVTIDALQEGIDFSGAGNSVTQLIRYDGRTVLNPKTSGN